MLLGPVGTQQDLWVLFNLGVLMNQDHFGDSQILQGSFQRGLKQEQKSHERRNLQENLTFYFR